LRNYFKYIVYLYVLIAFNLTHAGSYDDFFKAIELDQPEVVSDLLLRGFDPNSPSPKGVPALILTYQKKSFKVLDVLVDWKKTNLNVLSAEGENLLMLTAINNQLSLADRLINKGADINKTGWTALHYAASKGHIEMIRFLLDQQAYIDAESPNSTTPLMMAARYGNAKAVKLLLEEGADPRIRNKQGLSALDFANQPEKAGSKQYIKAFLDAWNHKYAQLPDQTPATERKKSVSITHQTGVSQITQTLSSPANEERVPPHEADAEIEKNASIQQLEVEKPAEILSDSSIFVPEQLPIEKESVEDSNEYERSVQTQSEAPHVDLVKEETAIEAVTGPGLPSNSIETNPVQPVLTPPRLTVFDSQKDLVEDKTNTEPTAAKKEEPVKSSAVRVRPLDPNSKKTPYTKQSQTRRIVTVDIIEVIPAAETNKDQ
jgi:hypothetical protein